MDTWLPEAEAGVLSLMGEQEPPVTREGKQANGADAERRPLFALGQLVGTPGAIKALEDAGEHPAELLIRHVTGDWGDLCEEDVAENELSVEQGLRVFSSYKLETGVKVWVITEWDRSATTILLPEEY